MESDPSEKLVVPALGERLIALGNLALGLGNAIKGISAVKKIDTTDDRDQLVENLKFVSKRLSWLERSTDPNWRPYVESSLANGGPPRTGYMGKRKPDADSDPCPY